MKRGPPPKPTALRLIEGNRAKRPLPPDEIRPPEVQTLPEPPPMLNALARDEWRVMGARLMGIGLLTIVDTSVFAMYCVAWADWHQAVDDLRALWERDPTSHGKMLKGPDGRMYTNPLWIVSQQASRQAHRFAAEFGMTPSARARLQIAVGPAASHHGPKTGTDSYFT